MFEGMKKLRFTLSIFFLGFRSKEKKKAHLKKYEEFLKHRVFVQPLKASKDQSYK